MYITKQSTLFVNNNAIISFDPSPHRPLPQPSEDWLQVRHLEGGLRMNQIDYRYRKPSAGAL